MTDKGLEYVNQLPDTYRKDTNSNNYKILSINALGIGTFENDNADVFNVSDIKQATGKTLDLYGESLGQYRGACNDTQYLILILSRIARNATDGTYESIINFLGEVFGSSCGIEIVETTDPATVRFEGMSSSLPEESGFTTTQIEEIISTLLPVGVAFDGLSFEGTFEFGGINDYDETAGFGNIEQTIGGALGMVVGDDTQGTLPI